jgi:hypothetical protein
MGKSAECGLRNCVRKGRTQYGIVATRPARLWNGVVGFQRLVQRHCAKWRHHSARNAHRRNALGHAVCQHAAASLRTRHAPLGLLTTKPHLAWFRAWPSGLRPRNLGRETLSATHAVHCPRTSKSGRDSERDGALRDSECVAPPLWCALKPAHENTRSARVKSWHRCQHTHSCHTTAVATPHSLRRASAP